MFSVFAFTTLAVVVAFLASTVHGHGELASITVGGKSYLPWNLDLYYHVSCAMLFWLQVERKSG